MRRIVCLALLLMLGGCGFNTWHDLPFAPSSNPNLPAGDSLNMRRVMGDSAGTEPLTPDLESQSGQETQPLPPVGSSTPPGSTQPGLAPLPSMPPPSTGQPAPVRPPATGQLYQTNQGPATSTGGTSNYQTLTTPGSPGQSIVVPNGNGTSTIIHPNGTVETVPTPKP
jgi:hypothetical protein